MANRKRRLNRIPRFRTEAEERAFWQTHDSTTFWDELTPVKLEFVTPRKKAVSVKLTGLEARVLQNILARLTGAHPHASSHRRG